MLGRTETRAVMMSVLGKIRVRLQNSVVETQEHMQRHTIMAIDIHGRSHSLRHLDSLMGLKYMIKHWLTNRLSNDRYH